MPGVIAPQGRADGANKRREPASSSPKTARRASTIAIEDTLEAGLVLTGTEVKSLRAGKANIAEAYASAEDGGELYLINAYIPEYAQAGRFNA